MKKFELNCACDHCRDSNPIGSPEWDAGCLKFEVTAEQIRTVIEVTCEQCKLTQKVYVGLTAYCE
jgi:hypothetical protein